MAQEELLAAINKSGAPTECPDDDELSVLWALAIGREIAGAPDLTAAETATIVRKIGRRSMSRQAALGHLTRLAKSPDVHRKKRRNRPDAFSIMASGDDRLHTTKTVTLVDPAKALEELRNLEDILSTLTGKVLICDPYMDNRTLDFIGCITGASCIKYLTERVTNQAKVKNELKVVAKQTGATIEVRRSSKGILHDRYIIHDGGMLVLGTSLNSFGMRQSFISRVGHDVRKAAQNFFEKNWKSACPL